MRKITAIILALFLCPVLQGSVWVLTSNEPPKPKDQKPLIYPTPSNISIDDEMLPATSELYIFEVCAYGRQPLLVPAHQQPAQRGTPVSEYKIRNYKPVHICKDYVGANTPQDKQNMVNAAMRDLQVPNRQSVSINLKASLGNPQGTFTVQDKALMPYTVPYNKMPQGSILKKILTDQKKIRRFYNFSLPAAVYLGSIIQKRPVNVLPIRISYYEEILANGQTRSFIVFVFTEGEKYTYQPVDQIPASDTIYDIKPDFAVQYLK